MTVRHAIIFETFQNLKRFNRRYPRLTLKRFNY
nr:MAG TPA: hypothetical protein [Caudoviricetes sp.]